ncbi:hypothetical protein L218DRAFT_242793 [Marasmius fiardii PR-910]|nr:hypothetical protein L218DRAFT_242793 [Marasmius fiardii PR-910]
MHQETPQFTARLTSLTVISTLPQSETPSAVKDLLEVIANRFDRSLTSLSVRINTQFPPATLASPSIYDVVSFQHIEPILRCSKMREFCFTHTLPVHLHHEDVDKIASSWPFIVNLHLCPDPRTGFSFDNSLAYLSLDSLVPFTKHCPLLEALEIPPDPIVLVQPGETRAVDELSTTPLRYLRTFSPGNVGATVSGQLDDTAVAMFLSRILSPGCQISFRTSWANTSGTEVTPEEWTVKWRDVKKGLVLIEAMRDRMRREALKTVEGLVKKRKE